MSTMFPELMVKVASKNKWKELARLAKHTDRNRAPRAMVEYAGSQVGARAFGADNKVLARKRKRLDALNNSDIHPSVRTEAMEKIRKNRKTVDKDFERNQFLARDDKDERSKLLETAMRHKRGKSRATKLDDTISARQSSEFSRRRPGHADLIRNTHLRRIDKRIDDAMK